MRYVSEWLFRKSETPGFFGNFIFMAFVLVQCFDGMFTYIGVSIWGLNIEANPIIGWMMLVMGAGPGLIVSKLVAVGWGLYFYWRGLHNFIVLLTGLYLIIAIIPWAHLFFTHQ